MDKDNQDYREEELRKAIQSIEWDIMQGTFNKKKFPYYQKLLAEYKNIAKKQKIHDVEV